jgi:hypothetical protein
MYRMPDHYGESKPEATMASKGKMSDKQKADLKKHMDKVGKDMSASEKKSHRMKMMGRMRKGESVSKAHKSMMK